MSSANILIIGNCVVDQVWQLDHFPEQDEELRAIGNTRVLGGNACNSAQILAQLEDNVEFVSSMAQDSAADWIIEQLDLAGISTRYCQQQSGFSSAESSIWLNTQNGSRTIVHHRDLPELSLNHLQQIPVENYQWIHLEGRNIDCLRDYLYSVKSLPCPVSLEIEKPRQDIEQLLPLVDTVIVSSAYLRSKEIHAEQCIAQFKTLNPALNIICTMGANGIMAAGRSVKLIQLDGIQVEHVIDTIGAGDCFIAGFIHQMTQRNDFAQALDFANRLAALKIQHQGMHINDE